MTSVADLIRKRLDETGATVTWVARKVSTPRQNFHLWLAGKTRPDPINNPDTFEKLADWLDVDATELRGLIIFESLIAKGWTKDDISDLADFAKGGYAISAPVAA